MAGFQCGIGIASGRAIAGRLGVYEQAKVGVYGPKVNLASRLESMTKDLRVPILLDDATADQIRSEIGSIPWARLRRVARVRPYGMTADFMVYELLPPVSEPGVLSEQNRRDYEAALDAFMDGNWSSARDLLSRLHRDGPSEFLLKYMEANHGSSLGKLGRSDRAGSQVVVRPASLMRFTVLVRLTGRADRPGSRSRTTPPGSGESPLGRGAGSSRDPGLRAEHWSTRRLWPVSAVGPPRPPGLAVAALPE